MGQFLSADPSDLLQPGVGVNRYAYAGGNPVAYADPYGLSYGTIDNKPGGRVDFGGVDGAGKSLSDRTDSERDFLQRAWDAAVDLYDRLEKGHIARKNNRRFRALERAGIIRSLGGDIGLITAALANLPPDILSKLIAGGVKWAAVKNSVAEYAAFAGVPRGWPPGTSWGNVPGIFDPSTMTVVVATSGLCGELCKPLWWK